RHLKLEEKPQLRLVRPVVNQHRERSDPIAGGVVAQQRPQRGRGDIGAASYGLGEDDLRTMSFEALERIYEIREAATKTAATYLVRGDIVAARQLSVHQIVALIVQHGGDGHTTRLKHTGCFQNQGGLASAQKAADDSQDRLHTRRSSPSRMVFAGDDFF